MDNVEQVDVDFTDFSRAFDDWIMISDSVNYARLAVLTIFVLSLNSCQIDYNV